MEKDEMLMTEEICETEQGATPVVCQKCGCEIQEGQAFCPSCGTKVGSSPEKETVSEPPKNKKKTIIVASIIIITLLAAGIFVAESMRAKREQERIEAGQQAKILYMKNVESFDKEIGLCVLNLSAVIEDIDEYWYKSIWEGKYKGDINVAITTALSDNAEIICDSMEKNKTIRELYNKIKTLSEGILPEDKAEMEEICDAVNTLYDAYEVVYYMAITPSGSYNSYHDDIGTNTGNYFDAVHKLDRFI